jgi:hypothetical protein
MNYQFPTHPPTGAPTEIRPPDADERRARAAVYSPEGKADYVKLQVARFDAAHPTVAAREEQAAAAERLKLLEKRLRRVDLHIERTERELTIISAKRIVRQPWVLSVVPMILLICGVTLLLLSNSVLSNYVVKSGSDLYATDPWGAKIFALTPVMASIGIKVFERFVGTDAARFWFRTTFFAVGMVSIVIWTTMSALVFAPDLGAGNSMSILEAPTNSKVAVLLLAHILSEMSFGYLTLTGAEHIAFSGFKKTVRANPVFTSLMAHQAALIREINDNRQKKNRAEEETIRINGARAETEGCARFDHDRAYQQWECGETIAAATSRNGHLNP